MNDSEREKLAIRAYRLCEVSDRDWKRIMPRYGQQLKEWRIIPNILWYSCIFAGIIAVGFNWYSPWLPIAALLATSYAAAQIGCRAGNVDGFQTGYEWGKIDGVCKGLGIKEAEQDELLQRAHDLIIEFKMESGDPGLELGEELEEDT